MSITVNKKKVKFVKHETVTDLLKRMHYTFPLIIVKIDNQLIKRNQYDDTIIPDNSDVKVIHLVSGG